MSNVKVGQINYFNIKSEEISEFTANPQCNMLPGLAAWGRLGLN